MGGPLIRWVDQRNLEAMLFSLDDATEKLELGSMHTGVESMVHTLTTMLGSLRDVVTPTGQV
jgi:hypothetical protein